MADFNSTDDVGLWVEEHGVEALRDRLVPGGIFSVKNKAFGVAWLDEQEKKGLLERESEAHDFMRRQTVAAEDSARSAKISARWAALGGLIALAMLFATAWPYFKLLDVVERLAK